MASGSFSKKTKGYTVKTDWSSTTNVAGNYSTVTCTHYLICSSGWDLYIGTRTLTCTAGETKSFTASSISCGTSGGTFKLGTTTHKVEHNSDGTKTISATTTFNLNASISGETISNITATGTMVLDDIPRASSLTASNGTLGTAQTLTINKSDSSFTHTITYTCGNASGTVVTKTSNSSVSWTPPLSLASQNTTGTSVSITFTITTYSGDESVGTATKAIVCTIPSSVKPTANVSVSDAMGYASTYGGYIQRLSKFAVTVTGTPIYSSPIASYSTTANGSTYGSSSFTTDVIKNSGTATITAKVTDKRGYYGTTSVTATVLAYSKPTLKISVARCDEDGTENMQGEYAKIKYSCSITTLNGKNTLTAVVKYKKSSASDYSSVTDISASTTASYTDRSIIIPADSGSSYDIEIDITDNFGTTAKTTSVSTAFTFHHYKGPNIEGEGKNLFKAALAHDDGSRINYANDNVSLDNNVFSFTATQSDMYFGEVCTAGNYYAKHHGFLIDVSNISNIAISLSNSAFTKNFITQYDANQMSLGFFHLGTANYIWTVPSEVKYISLRFGLEPATIGTTYSTTVQIEKGTVITDFEPYIPAFEASMGLGKLAELEGGLDIGFKTRFSGGIEIPLLPAGTDLNDLMQPNIYRCGSSSAYSYVNYPVTGSVVGHLEVFTAGVDRIGQKYTVSHQTRSYSMYRYYQDGAWGAWQSYLTGETVLYNNSSGSDGTISLSPVGTVGNSKYLEIYYNDNNAEGYGYTRLPIKDNAFQSGASPIVVHLGLIEASNSSRTYIRRTKYTITNSSMTPTIESAGYGFLDGGSVLHSGGTNYIKIIKVVAIR